MGGLADQVLTRHPQQGLVGPVHHHDAAFGAVLDDQGKGHVLDHRAQEGPGLFQLDLGPPPVGDVLADGQHVGLSALVAAHGDLGLADAAHAAGGREVGLFDDGRGAGQGLAVLLGDPGRLLGEKQFGRGPANVILARGAEQLLGRAVHHQDAAVLVLDHDLGRDVVQDGVGELARLPDLFLGLLLRRQVPRDDQEAADLAAIVAPGGRVPHHPAALAVGQDDQFRFARHALAGQAALVQGAVALARLGDQVIGAVSDGLGLGQVEVPQPGRADLDETQIAVGHGHGDGRAGDEGLDAARLIVRLRTRLWGSVGPRARLRRGVAATGRRGHER